MPGCFEFNAKVNHDTIPRTCTVGYFQVIHGSPTELSVVFNVLKHSVDMDGQLNQEDVVIILYQAIYSKSLEIIWKRL